jgi:hypothetical protein
MQKFTLILLCFCISVGISNCSEIQNESRNSNVDGKSHSLSDDSLLTLIQFQTFQYFWDGAEPTSGMARERYHMDNVYPENDKNIITTGGSGFGLMAILVGIQRGFIGRDQGVNRFIQIVHFLQNADRYHGAWPHWLNGETGKIKPFSPKDNGADLVETAYLVQGLLTVREFFKDGNERERQLSNSIDKLWKEVDWAWFTKGGENVIYWHWSPTYGWAMNFPVKGYNECLILYILASSSPTYPVVPAAYHQGWARGGAIKSNNEKYGYKLGVQHNGAEEYGGPLFWAHYSYLALDPRFLKDQYADYWQVNKNQTLINRQWCMDNPDHYKGYGINCWGLTASYSMNGYAAHSPGDKKDLGVISPTAALSSFPYTPEYSMQVLKHFYYDLGHLILGPYGFYDAFSEQNNWYPQKYLAIDQGPIVVMIENYRSGMMWKLFMGCPEIRQGLTKLGFTYK